ncbi:MAG: mechanosensitive ion channel family protein [Saprospiraceae bacterium]|nr:mechanosensitive ion channel family protein [Saprospiraceae bacterium]
MREKHHVRAFFYFLLLCTSLCQISYGQSNQEKLARTTPHDAIWVHLYYLQPDNYLPARSAEAFMGGDSSVREDWAIKLKQIFDGEGLYVHMNQLPQEENYVDSITKKQYYTPFPSFLPEIYLEKSAGKWHYSLEASEVIDELHKRIYPMGTDQLVSLFSDRSGKKFLGLSGWQYLGIFILLAFGALFYLLISITLRFVIRKSSGIKLSSIEDFRTHVRKIASVISIWLLLWAVKLFVPLLQLPVKVSAFIQTSLRILITLSLMWLALRVLNLLMAYMEGVTAKTESRMDEQLSPLLKQILKIIIIGIGLLQVLNLLNFNVTALIAGVSIGGLALALAAQDTVKNFLGSFMIFTDRPFQIGDWVEGNDFAGTVVQVGFRSTRIRTPDTSIITVPNGSMANVNVTNKGVRQYRLFQTKAGITYDTPPDTIEKFVAGIKEILSQHPEVADEDIYVYFTEMADFSLNIFIRAYMVAPTYVDELRIKESIQLAILRWAEAIHVRFAFPSSTIHIEDLPGQLSLTPKQKLDQKALDEVWQSYFQKYRSQFPLPTGSADVPEA